VTRPQGQELGDRSSDLGFHTVGHAAASAILCDTAALVPSTLEEIYLEAGDFSGLSQSLRLEKSMSAP